MGFAHSVCSCSITDFIADDFVLVEKFSLSKYKFSHGDVVVFRYSFCSAVWISFLSDLSPSFGSKNS